ADLVNDSGAEIQLDEHMYMDNDEYDLEEGEIPLKKASSEFLKEFRLIGSRGMPTIVDSHRMEETMNKNSQKKNMSIDSQEILKFCDYTLKKVMGKVKEINRNNNLRFVDPPHIVSDRDVMNMFELEIKKHLTLHDEEAEAFNLIARNFCKFFRKGNRFGCGNRFDNGANRFGRGHSNSFGNRGGESSRKRRGFYNCGEEGHFIGECPKPKENKAFVGRAWSDSKDGDEPQNDATCIMVIDSQYVQPKLSTSNNKIDLFDFQKENEELIRFNKDFTKTFTKLLNETRSLKSEKSKLLSKINDLEFEVKKLKNIKEVVEPCKKCDVLIQEVDSLKCSVSKFQDEALNFSKLKKSSIVLDDMLSRQKLSQDKEGTACTPIRAMTYSYLLMLGCPTGHTPEHVTLLGALLLTYVGALSGTPEQWLIGYVLILGALSGTPEQ
ncbi:protein CHUP1, chloroplastic, partial [Tanacetum coccineum]